MGIWHSIDFSSDTTSDVLASNLHDTATDNITGEGRDDLEIDVATATAWNNRIRLAIFPADGRHGLDEALVLDVDAAVLLADRLQIAAATARPPGRRCLRCGCSTD